VGSAVVQSDRALISFYRLSIVTSYRAARFGHNSQCKYGARLELLDRLGFYLVLQGSCQATLFTCSNSFPARRTV